MWPSPADSGDGSYYLTDSQGHTVLTVSGMGEGTWQSPVLETIGGLPMYVRDATWTYYYDDANGDTQSFSATGYAIYANQTDPSPSEYMLTGLPHSERPHRPDRLRLRQPAAPGPDARAAA
jgi:hypothetical protein